MPYRCNATEAGGRTSPGRRHRPSDIRCLDVSDDLVAGAIVAVKRNIVVAIIVLPEAKRAEQGQRDLAVTAATIQAKRALMNSTMAMNCPAYKFVSKDRPSCSRCGRPLVLARIEPSEPGVDMRTYFCAHCADQETVVARA